MPRKSSKATEFFRKVGDAVLKADKAPAEIKRRLPKVRKKPSAKKPEIPRRFRGYFEQRHLGWPEYIMLKAQAVILALFLITVVYVVLLPGEALIFISILLAVSVFMVYLTMTQIKRAFEMDYPAYRSFMFMCLAIAWVFIITLRHLPIEFSPQSAQMAIIPPFVSILFVVVAFTVFRLKYGRNFTHGVVEQVQGHRAVVRVGYDIRSNVKAGLYPVESFVRIKRGDMVKLNLERSILGLRGSRIRTILQKVQPPTKALKRIQ
jgi:uncharacterized membrane protein